MAKGKVFAPEFIADRRVAGRRRSNRSSLDALVVDDRSSALAGAEHLARPEPQGRE
jgi:hypothetical protein